MFVFFTMKHFLLTLPRNLLRCFSGWNLAWHLTAIVLTVVLVLSGLDWQYYLATRNPGLRYWVWPAVFIGGLVPIWVPLFLLILGSVIGNARVRAMGWALGQAALLGSLVSSAYKAFTGRAHPARLAGEDLSRIFHFGFWRGGVFWGWPSSHATIAFAMAVAAWRFGPKQRWIGILALAYAFYVGIGVSMTSHWFSDFVAGAIIGSIIGVVVGMCFRKALNSEP